MTIRLAHRIRTRYKNRQMDEPEQPDATERTFTTVTVPISLRDRIRAVRDRLMDNTAARLLLPPSLRARWEALQRTDDGRPRGNIGLSVVVELMADAFDDRVAADAKKDEHEK
jgi:hypothetical protein